MPSPFLRFWPVAKQTETKYNKGDTKVERNYGNMSFFNYDAYLKLADKIKSSGSPDAADDLEALNDAMTSFREYVNKVDAGEQQILLAAVRFEGDEYREMVSRYDRNRHDQHETAIANTRLVNRLAELYGVEPLFTGDDKDRLAVADFTLDVVTKLFQNRIMNF